MKLTAKQAWRLRENGYFLCPDRVTKYESKELEKLVNQYWAFWQALCKTDEAIKQLAEDTRYKELLNEPIT